MVLRVSMYTDLDDQIVQIGSRTLAEPGPRSAVYFGRLDESDVLRRAARGGAFLGVERGMDDWVSRDQGAVHWTAEGIVVTNHSDKRPLLVREWGRKGLDLYDRQDRVLLNGRAVVDIVDTSTFLIVGPEDPYEPGWLAPLPEPSEETPGQAEIARFRIRPEIVCSCRADGGRVSLCQDSKHEARERRLRTMIVSEAATTAWPQGRVVRERRDKAAAERLGITVQRISQLKAEFRRVVAEGSESVSRNAPSSSELVEWLVQARVLTFDDVIDLVEEATR
ncbi:MAG: hypothetical protein QM621_04130 [Aeromicrobium sp.]|uniref:hypothetical protein n=1 Tax=Aeromicrobium sp. TaxID=1871063 RepID=UPI0039E2596E